MLDYRPSSIPLKKQFNLSHKQVNNYNNDNYPISNSFQSQQLPFINQLKQIRSLLVRLKNNKLRKSEYSIKQDVVNKKKYEKYEENQQQDNKQEQGIQKQKNIIRSEKNKLYGLDLISQEEQKINNNNSTIKDKQKQQTQVILEQPSENHQKIQKSQLSKQLLLQNRHIYHFLLPPYQKRTTWHHLQTPQATSCNKHSNKCNNYNQSSSISLNTTFPINIIMIITQNQKHKNKKYCRLLSIIKRKLRKIKMEQGKYKMKKRIRNDLQRYSEKVCKNVMELNRENHRQMIKISQYYQSIQNEAHINNQFKQYQINNQYNNNKYSTSQQQKQNLQQQPLIINLKFNILKPQLQKIRSQKKSQQPIQINNKNKKQNQQNFSFHKFYTSQLYTL